MSEASYRPGRSGERAKERDAPNPTEIGAVLRTGAAVHPSAPYPGRSARFRASGRPEGGNDDRPMALQKSDLFVVARKPVKAGGAKGEME